MVLKSLAVTLRTIISMQVAKYVLPVVTGAMSGMILIVAGRALVKSVCGLPEGVGGEGLPGNALVMFLVSYMVCSFLAGLIATLVAQRLSVVPAIVVGVLLTLAGIYDILKLSLPGWFMVLNLLVYVPCAYSGGRVAVKKAPAA